MTFKIVLFRIFVTVLFITFAIVLIHDLCNSIIYVIIKINNINTVHVRFKENSVTRFLCKSMSLLLIYIIVDDIGIINDILTILLMPYVPTDDIFFFSFLFMVVPSWYNKYLAPPFNKEILLLLLLLLLYTSSLYL